MEMISGSSLFIFTLENLTVFKWVNFARRRFRIALHAVLLIYAVIHFVAEATKARHVILELNNRHEKSTIKNYLLKYLHTSRPTLKYSEKLKTLKEYSRNYWYAVAPIYITNNSIWFLICEYVIYQEFDVINFLRQLQISDAILNFLTSHFIGKHALSLLLFKIITPLRFLTMYQSSKTIIGYISKNNLLPPKPFNIRKKPKR